ncbi:thermonuclease family protein [Candidatus Reidiella endopervernicosa]|uniref:Thermonuclease family protein n=1 Tax=Candidatus Reidiella endopervernicosa TaxID=2738883 RepID=A0A6N0HUD2_9GAMM|nr:thermonuclease family protein [Candidatus Reidiella endopervernicosa]QKQ25781.1 thermonuclease family protein [Candidatus Reidiella endopervernicosa]
MRTTALLLLLTLTATINAEIYRWRDSSGQLHFGDRPTSGAEQVTLPGIDLERSRYPLDKVIDGDTIRLKDGRSVRLLGINAPEVAHHNSPAQSGGDAAREALVALLPEKSVILEFDRERHDHYDRLLAHLFNDDGENINSKLLRQGIVYQVARPPNLKYADDYRSAEQQARREQLGIWMLDEYQLTPASGADKFRNSFRRLTTHADRHG